MSRIRRYTFEEAMKLKGRTDWERVDALTDEEIESAVAADPDAPPLLDEEWFKNAVWHDFRAPKGDAEKKQISIRLDRDIIDYFKNQGRGYQTRINHVLRAFVAAQR